MSAGEDLTALLSERKITRDQLDRFLECFGLGDTHGYVGLQSHCWANQSLWMGATFGVATCSNHAEGLHRAINKSVSDYRLPIRRLAELIACVDAKYQNALRFTHRQGVKLVQKLRSEPASMNLEAAPRFTNNNDNTFAWSGPSGVLGAPDNGP
jgi:hypothetical protein